MAFDKQSEAEDYCRAKNRYQWTTGDIYGLVGCTVICLSSVDSIPDGIRVVY